MKNQFLLIVCCLAFVFSGMAQPKTGLTPEKFAEKMKHERLDKKIILDKEKLVAYQKKMLLAKMQTPEKSQKSEDWWEPDVIYQDYDYYNGSLEVRRTFTYEKEHCTVDLWHERAGSQWVNAIRFTYTYDLQNNRTSKTGQSWEGTQWRNEEICLYKYDTQNNMIEEMYQYWYGYWETEVIITYAYDSQNKLTEKKYLFLEDDEWWAGIKIIYTYNTQNNLDKEQYQYSEDDDQWEDAMIVTYSYDSQDRMTEALLRVNEDFWEDAAKLIFTYDVEKNTITQAYYYWDDDEWEGEEVVVFTYDTQNNLISEAWGYGLDDDWEADEQYTYSYDENNNATTGFFEYAKQRYFWDDEYPELTVYYNNMQSELFTFECSRFTATYIKPSEIGIKESDLLTNSVNLYPNPVSNMLYIETDNGIAPEVKIYSIQGALLMNVKGNQIDISSLPSGIYIAKINEMNRKFIKQ